MTDFRWGVVWASFVFVYAGVVTPLLFYSQAPLWVWIAVFVFPPSLASWWKGRQG